MKDKRIIAVDFDGTLCENKYPEIGEPILSTINELKQAQRNGATVILWTCRCGEELAAAVEWCKDCGITFDAVNENLAEQIKEFGGDTRKIFATEYWDDRAARPVIFSEELKKAAVLELANSFLGWLNENLESLDKTIRWGRESGATIKGIEAYIRAAQVCDTVEHFKKLLKMHGFTASE